MPRRLRERAPVGSTGADDQWSLQSAFATELAIGILRRIYRSTELTESPLPAQIPPYVAVADPNRWVVKRGGVTAWKLLRLGFLWWPGAFEKKWGKPQSFASMGAFAMELRDLGVAFSAGRDWSPSEVVQYLRDEGHFAGHFTEIAWRTDGGWELNTL